MKFLDNSIKKFDAGSEPFYEFSQKISKDQVDIIVIPFRYVSLLEELSPFTAKDLQVIVHKAFNSNIEVRGDLELQPFDKSKADIDIHIFCGGIDSKPKSKNDLPCSEWGQAEKNVGVFWHEVEKIFKIPPTRVYNYTPNFGTCFDGGDYWQFSYILLNDNTGDGVILYGQCLAD